MKASVALATYNGSAYLGEQLASLLAQTRSLDEIVVSDDHSSDGTVGIARQALGALDPQKTRVSILESPHNQGVSRNFESAIAACHGDIVFLCDQDDYWMPEKVERMLDAFARSPELILLYSNALLVGARRERLPSTQFSALGVTGQELALVRSGHAFDALLHRNLVTGATAAFRREVFELARPFPREWVHDEWIAAIASALGRVDFIADALIEYRQHASNEIGMRPLSVTERFENLFRKRGDFCAREASRGQILLDRLIALGDRIPPDKVHRLRERIAHLQFRDRLPRRRLARVVPVAREALTGRYSAYGRGLRSILRDLLEPL